MLVFLFHKLIGIYINFANIVIIPKQSIILALI